MTAIDPSLIPVLHKHGPRACHGLALYTRRRWVDGDILRTSDVVWGDGRQPIPDELVRCWGCGVVLNMSEFYPL